MTSNQFAAATFTTCALTRAVPLVSVNVYVEREYYTEHQHIFLVPVFCCLLQPLPASSLL